VFGTYVAGGIVLSGAVKFWGSQPIPVKTERRNRGEAMDDLIKDFLVESNENLDRLDSELVKLESDPSSQDLLSSIFRTIRTIKGSCGFLGFSKLEKVAHAGESLLSLLRDGKIPLVPELTSGLLSMVDAIRTILAEIQTSGQDGKEDYPELIETLKLLQQPAKKPTKLAASPRNSDPPKKIPAPNAIKTPLESNMPPSAASQTDHATSARPESTRPSSALEANDSSARTEKSDGLLVEPGLLEHDELTAALQEHLSVDDNRRKEPPTSSGPAATDEIPPRVAAAETIRVDIHLLDRLMNLVGELVLTRNQITQFSSRQSDINMIGPTQQLNLLTSELQEEVMKTRMQPISIVFDKFPRVVRDVALGCGKQVQIEMEGKETELDKGLLEAIKDPLTHIVRNSVDHGIETPDKRVARGKPPEGHLKLRAFHEGGQVVIEISDDGAGIDAARVKNKALERGLITPAQATHMSEREILNLIFLPGFSTAEKVTNLSGRGVGMDVVKTNVDRVNGSVDLQSSAGKGTTIRIKIPLTLAIVRAVIVQSAGKRFAIPQVSIQELVRLDGEQLRTAIELVHGVPVYRMRGRLLPLIYLSEELKLRADGGTGVDVGAAINIVVLEADGHTFGLVVNKINDSEEIVVKPLSKQLKSVKVFAGATIMGDGKVALILDVVGLAQGASILSEVRDRSISEETVKAKDDAAEKQTFLLFSGPDDARMALPLAGLARLEEFAAAQVEQSGNQWVVQYRGSILPLIRLSEVLEERRTRLRHPEIPSESDMDPLQVLVCNDDGQTIGLVVNQILDIVEDRAETKSPATRPGVQYAVVISERVTELLDIPAIKRIAATKHVAHGDYVEVTN
jgi:two-component system, chemotaxis family, sensor kinase CheA